MAFPSEIESDVLDRVKLMVELGFESEPEIVDVSGYIFEDEPGCPAMSWIGRATRERLNDHLQSQNQWQRPTDVERLDGVFDRLRALGILALHYAGETQQQCIQTVMTQTAFARARGAPVRGCLFYSTQDAERAVQGGLLLLGFGALPAERRPSTPADNAAVGEEVADALRSAGFRVEWDGTSSGRLGVDLTWRAPRRPDGAPLLSAALYAQ